MKNMHYDKDIQLGEKTLITDPCYSKGTWCSGAVKTEPGTYRAYSLSATSDPYRQVEGGFIVHSSLDGKILPFDCQIDTGIDVGVDSGECGVYDDAKFPEDGIDIEEDAEFSPTHEYRGYGIDWGKTFHSFGGDGSFKAYVHKNDKGSVDAIRIDFYGDYEDWDEDEDPIYEE